MINYQEEIHNAKQKAQAIYPTVPQQIIFYSDQEWDDFRRYIHEDMHLELPQDFSVPITFMGVICKPVDKPSTLGETGV